MIGINRSVPSWNNYSYEDVPFEKLAETERPVVLKGLVQSWPLVKEGMKSGSGAIDYLKSFYNGLTVGFYEGPPEIAGRLFYNDNYTELNFTKHRIALDLALEKMRSHLDDPAPPTLYVGSTSLDICLPGLSGQNDLNFEHPVFQAVKPLKSIWIGNRSTASAHFDAPHNIACVAVGRRRVTLFPPDQTKNLYLGPLEPTPGGQVISLVDMSNPDLKQFPRFQEAMDVAEVAELGPGDAIYIPSMWWHHIEGLSAFNVLINYWWSTAPKYMGSPMDVVYHALLSIKGRPLAERLAWKNIFDYYVFNENEQAIGHLPKEAHGLLGKLNETSARKLRALLLNKLNR